MCMSLVIGAYWARPALPINTRSSNGGRRGAIKVRCQSLGRSWAHLDS